MWGITLNIMSINIFVTGASGCIGHYALVALKNEFPNATLHLMVRNKKKFKIDALNWPNVVVHQGDMDDVEKFKTALKEADYLVHIATVWGYDLDVNIRINRDRTLEMFNYLDPNRVKKSYIFQQQVF